MLILTLYGIPRELADSGVLTTLVMEDLPMAASSIPAMEITPDVVTTFVPADLVNDGLGNEVILFIEGPFMREEPTPEVRQRFADALRDCVRDFVVQYVPGCKMVEIIPRSQRPDDGFAEWHKTV